MVTTTLTRLTVLTHKIWSLKQASQNPEIIERAVKAEEASAAKTEAKRKVEASLKGTSAEVSGSSQNLLSWPRKRRWTVPTQVLKEEAAQEEFLRNLLLDGQKQDRAARAQRRRTGI